MIKTTLDFLALWRRPNVRRDAAIKLGQDQNLEYITDFKARALKETSAEVRKALLESIAIIQLTAASEETRLMAIQKLDQMRSINGLTFLQKLESEVRAAPAKFSQPAIESVHKAILDIESYIRWGNLFGTAFRGLSLSAVFGRCA